LKLNFHLEVNGYSGFCVVIFQLTWLQLFSWWWIIFHTLSNTTLAGNDIFYTNNIEKTTESGKNKYQSKYEEKILVWIAISPMGICKPYFRNSGNAINIYMYRDEVLKPYLLPFIQKYHKNNTSFGRTKLFHISQTRLKPVQSKIFG